MLTKLRIKLKPTDGSMRLYHHHGSLLHGYLMQVIEGEYAAELHGNNLKPFSQHIVQSIVKEEKDIYYWHINTLSEAAKHKIIDRILDLQSEKIFLENRNASIQIMEKEITEEYTYASLVEEYYILKDVKRSNVLQFMTPTTYKAKGNYVLFPELVSVYKGIINRWNEFADTFLLEDEEFLALLYDSSHIAGYTLRSTRYEMERVRINAFLGEICTYCKGAEGLARIAAMLLKFAEFAGIGAKTALGMGGVKLITPKQ